MTENKLQSSRYEYKYHVTEQESEQIYEFVRCFLEPDQYTPEGFTDGYAVHSLYLDSPDLYTCVATQKGAKNRFKLRVRFYDEDPSHPVFFEIKRRQTAVILKQRALVHRQFVDGLLNGDAPNREQLAKNDLKNWKALYDFCELRDAIDARPAAYTSYMRAGYEPPDSNLVRVTFDRRIRAGRYTGKLNALDVDNWPMVHVPGVVLELKFTDRFPNWMQDLTDMFDLTRGSMPKYVECVTLLNSVPS